MTAPSRAARWGGAAAGPLSLGGSGDGPVGVVHVVAEYAPFARTGGLAEAVAGLASFQAAAGIPTAVVLPLHRSARRTAPALVPVGRPFSVEVGPRLEWARLLRLPGAAWAPRVFFIEHEGYFSRPGIYGHAGADFGDNGLRFGFFACAVLAILPRIARPPLVLHAHDWHTALVPVYLRTRHAGHPYYDRVRPILSVHNAAFQGHFPEEILRVIGLPASLYDWRLLEWYGRVNFLKGGMAFADAVITVSPSHAAELCTPKGGFGLHEAFTALGDRFVGIVNGIDADVWNPEADPHLPATFTADDVAGKRRCKVSLQRAFGLPQRQNVPLIGMAARLVAQKGLDLLIDNARLFRLGAQFVFAGRGEARYEVALAGLAAHSHQRIGVKLAFTDRLAHRLIAGADLFLVPSLYEPCGLTQMTSQRYGTLPIGRRVGGLADTIADGETGFLFHGYSPAALAAAVRRAVDAYADPPRWQEMTNAAMTRDFSWGRSAAEYSAVYRRVLASTPAAR